VIPRKRNSLKGNADMDWGLYRYRHLVENAFARLKQYRAIATRYDKLKRNYESMVAIACGYLVAIYVKCQQTLKPRRRRGKLCLSEVMTIVVGFHLVGLPDI
jgi:hypothetical protein